MKKIENEESKFGRMKIIYLNKYIVQIKLDNKSIDFLIDVLQKLKNKEEIHHFNFDSDTGYSMGFMTRNTIDLILNNRYK